jgi:predicted RNA-binding Zn-ribbon protein involved in translation (DUF1610 family)
VSTACEICTAPTNNAFLCNQHVGELRGALTALATGPAVNGHRTEGLLAALADVANKQTRMGGGNGHRKRGDELPAPFEPDTEKGRSTKQGEASRLLDEARNTLTTIIRGLCEDRGVIAPVLDTAEMAVWLAGSVQTISLDEDAGRIWSEVDGLKRRIERAIDRPVRFELLGMCTTQLDGHKLCDTPLRAREDAIEVRCPKCRTVRRCDLVRRMGQSDARRALITWPKLLETNRGQPDGWRVSERTLRDWKATGALRAQQYLRPGGGHGYSRRSDVDVPLYAWSDVERLRSHGVPKGHRKRVRTGR